MRSNSDYDRKSDHIRICLNRDVQSRGISTGFERWRLVHQALPELEISAIDLSTDVAGFKLRFPLIVSAMTGGTPEAKTINRNLALAAQELGLAMFIGSQRPALENSLLEETYRVRRWAPTIPLFANLGAVQLNMGYGPEECRRAVEMIEADGLVLHLNPLQEALQPEGDRDFRNIADRIASIVAALSVPVVVKEVGWGISKRTAHLLYNAGVRIVDVAGAGGTSWSQVESFRTGSTSGQRIAEAFRNWGIPTAEAIQNVLAVSQNTTVIASGGIRTGVDVAKALALGAKAAGVALPLLAPASNSPETVIERLREFEQELRIALFCTASRSIVDLSHALEEVPYCYLGSMQNETNADPLP